VNLIPPVTSNPTFKVTAIGTPAPQGSKRHVGRGVMIESSKKVKPWREAVKQAASDLIAVAGETGRLTAGFPLDGPLVVTICFTLARPKSAPKSRTRPDRMPDLSKLIRSTEDALTDAGVWADDARVVGVAARKVYPFPGSGDPDALSVPGAVIRIWEVTT
jgi:Holliday junction resolvase RusA-like endonuclease